LYIADDDFGGYFVLWHLFKTILFGFFAWTTYVCAVTLDHHNFFIGISLC